MILIFKRLVGERVMQELFWSLETKAKRIDPRYGFRGW